MPSTLNHLASIAADLARINTASDPELLAIAVAQLSGKVFLEDELTRYMTTFRTYVKADEAGSPR